MVAVLKFEDWTRYQLIDYLDKKTPQLRKEFLIELCKQARKAGSK